MVRRGGLDRKLESFKQYTMTALNKKIDTNGKMDLSIVLPCLDEEKAIKLCIDQITKTVSEHEISTEIIIVDNNSKDGSVNIINSIIEENNKTNRLITIYLVHEPIRGYGSAYQKGFSYVKGKYVLMADLDGTYDFSDIPRFIDELKKGSDLVVGNRFAKISNKNIADSYSTDSNNRLGSMPWHHKYIGNPVLSGLVRLFFGVKIKDIHCGIRAIKRESLNKINLRARGMEFASEMIIKATKENLLITEIPVAYNERFGSSKLNSFQDGWRHLRFILIYSPMVIFLIPGVIIFLTGIVSTLGTSLYTHQLLLSAGCTIIGYQLIYFTFFAKIYAITHLGENNPLFEKLFRYITLEKAGIAGILALIVGILNEIYGNPVKGPIFGLILLVIGVQTISSAFMLSILAIKEK